MPGRHSALLRQLAGLAGSLLLSRVVAGVTLIGFAALTGPEPFAAFGAYLAVVTIMSVVASGRYEQALMFISSDREASAVSWLAIGIAMAVVGAIATASTAWLLFRMPVPAALAENWLLLLIAPVSLAVRAFSQVALNLATRQGNFTILGRANLVQALLQACAQFGLLWAGLEPVLCLATAETVGLLGAGALVASTSSPVRRILAARPSIVDLRTAAASWKMMPCWNMPTSLLSVAASSAPALLLPMLYSAAIAGQLLIGIRLMEMPTNVFASAVTPLLQKQLASRSDKENSIWSALKLLAALAFPGFTLAAIVAISSAALFVGTQWSVAIEAVPWLAPYFAGLAVSGPLVALVPGLRAEQRAVLYHAAFLTLTLAVAALGGIGVAWQTLLAAFGATMMARAALFGLLLVRSARDFATKTT
jgi:O-antigen/teichoic acid export membrane protein